MPSSDLSVVVANYNHAAYLPRALDAILSQSARPREVIVVDDASNRDDSWAVIEGYARRDPLVRAVRNERNAGAVPTYNRGVALATGEYIFLAAADDYVLPGYFERIVTAFDRHPHAGISCAYDSYTRGATGAVVPNASGWCETTTYFTPDEVARRLKCNLSAHGMIMRREPFLAAGGYLADLAWYTDWFAYLTLVFRHGLVHVPETLAVRTLELEGAYSAGAKNRDRNVAALGAYLTRITSPAYADVAPLFRRSGAATYFGADLIRAAARRPDRFDPAVFGFVVGVRPDEVAEVLADADPAAREFAEFLLGPQRDVTLQRQQQLEAELAQARADLAAARSQLPPPGAAAKLRWLAGKAVRRAFAKAG